MPDLIHAETGSPEWLAARRTGITATDIVTILGLSSYDSSYSLFWRKMDQVPEQPDNDRMRLGRDLEPIVLARWDEAHPDLSCDLTGAVTVRSDTRPWQMATPDSVVYAVDVESRVPGVMPAVLPDIIGTLEVKTWDDRAKDHWQDGPPPRVRAQVLWQMDTYDVATGHVGVLFLPSGEFRSYVIEHHGMCELLDWQPGRDVDRCSVCEDIDLMRTAGEDFMARLQLELPPPDPDASAATLAAQRARFTRQPDKTVEVSLETWNAWIGSKIEQKCWEDQVRAVEIELREQAGEASVLTVDGQPVARRYVLDQHVKEHTRHVDYLKRIRQKGNDDGA